LAVCSFDRLIGENPVSFQAWVPTWSVDLIPPDAVIDERRGVLVGETKQANEDELDSRNEIEV